VWSQVSIGDPVTSIFLSFGKFPQTRSSASKEKKKKKIPPEETGKFKIWKFDD
jgi:hypothetical protein